MSAAVGRSASKIGQAVAKTVGKASDAGKGKSETALNKSAKRDPELYVDYTPVANIIVESDLTSNLDSASNHVWCIRSCRLPIQFVDLALVSHFHLLSFIKSS